MIFTSENVIIDYVNVWVNSKSAFEIKSCHIKKRGLNFEVLISDLRSARKTLFRKNSKPGTLIKIKILWGA